VERAAPTLAPGSNRRRPSFDEQAWGSGRLGAVDPIARRLRPTRVRRLALSCAALLLPLSLAACSGDDGDDDVASDPAPTTATASPSPTAEPTVGTYPAFAATDYTFQLTVSCFCMGAGVPIEVTVANAEVVDAVYGLADGGRGGVEEGDPADKAYWLTINDVIDSANDTDAARVDVEWPAGQDYPSSVYVDNEEMVADDEVGYTIAEVEVS
jgi:hypothetical protein